MNKDKIYIFDTTLRDGEQSPGFSMNVDEKLLFAKQLTKLNVDVIEAGFPVSSAVQFEAVKRIAEEIEGPTIAGLARALENDIVTCYNAVKHAQKSRIHLFIATSPIHMEFKLKKSVNEVLKMAVDSIKLACSLCDEVEFSAEDATRSDINFLSEIVFAAIEAGAKVINIPDTVGYTTPNEFYIRISELFKRVKNINRAVISVHCHNDLGLAVGNSLSAIEAGARQVECTINGIGERAGNASLEEIVMALNVRKDYYKIETNINAKEIFHSSTQLSNITGIFVQPNKAIVGKNAFAHESGIHQDGMLKYPQTYEIMTPESIGRPKSSIVLGRHSGKHGFRKRLAELQIILEEEDLEKAYKQFIVIADKKKEIYDEDLYAIIADEIRPSKEMYKIIDFHTFCGNDPAIASATVILEKEGEHFRSASTGDGPINALFNAIDKISNIALKLERYTINSVTAGTDAIGEVSVVLNQDGRIISGHGSSTDIIHASAKAYINSINKLIQEKHIKKTLLENV
ncbi:MAG: 2-isopropylmalate synthase [Spirochaetota bacterium]|nr:2-isopropylmalate synthase [Spirochaetota bacterium]